ncbi:MAG: PAS domain S-box protein [Promethearchaeota archaeon]
MRIDDILKNIPPHIGNQVEDLINQYIQEKERSNEKKFQDLIHNLLDLVVETDSEGVFTFVGPQIVDLLGYQPEEVIGRNGFEFIHPEDQVSAIESLGKAMSGSHVFDYEYRAKHKDGYYVWLSASGRSIEKGQEHRLILIIKDISERKRVGETFRKGEQQYLSILESMGDAIHVINRDLRFSFINSTFKRWNDELGLQTDVIGHKIDKIFPFLAKRVLDEYHQVFSTGKPLVTEESTRIDEREFFTETRKIPLFDGNEVIQVVTIIRDITERKLGEEELKRGKNEREQILNSLVEHVVYQDTHHRILWANQAACDSVDTTLDQLVGQYCYQVWNQRTEPCLGCPVVKALQTQKSQDNEMTTPDGRVWFIQGNPVFNSNNEIIGAVETTLEITERKAAEEAVRESKDKYQMLVEKLREGVLLEDSKGLISFINPQIVRMLGYSENELIGKHYSYIVPEEELEKVKTEASKRPKGIRYTYEASLLTKEKNRVPVIITTTSLFSKEGEFSGVLSVFTDITERKQTEAALQKSEERYRKLVELSPDAITLTDLDANIIMVNQQTASLYGYKKDELIGKNSFELIAPRDRERAIKGLQETLEDGILRNDEYKLLRKDGSIIIAEINVEFLTDEEGKPTGFIVVTRDITERIKAREEREKLEQMRKEFMDQAAHELRTPLTIIKGYTEFLQMRETNEENIIILNTIMNNIIRLEELGTSVSDIYRIERGKFEIVLEKMDFNDFLENFLNPYLKLYEGQFHFNGDRLKDHVLINGDSKRLKNVLSNVLDNAIRNTPIETRKITVELTVTEQFIELLIKDNGAGIKPENLPRVFEKFTTFPTKYDITGTGIGLYIAREIINAHNGSISAYSEGEDKGTMITIKLPRLHE